jgi:hypothetical protein
MQDKIKETYQIPCGPMGISAEGVCRRSLRDSFDKLLDRLTRELHPYSQFDELPKGLKAKGDVLIEEGDKEDMESRKRRLIEEGRIKAEAKLAIKKYEEELQGNSKLLQDPSGKMDPW